MLLCIEWYIESYGLGFPPVNVVLFLHRMSSAVGKSPDMLRPEIMELYL